MPKYTYRKYKPGDETAINHLYFEVTGRQRTTEQYLWQWHRAPGGVGDVWLIEVENEDGSVKLIGHHGIMPIRFSCGEKNLLAGKTENTMVHPAFRRKILYPKYEKQFLAAYENRFDLLFSTIGPAPALRQRKALGYRAEKKWLQYAWGLNFGAYCSLVATALSYRKQSVVWPIVGKMFSACGKGVNKLSISFGKKITEKNVVALTSKEAMDHGFFEKFWEKSRGDYDLTPRRDREDLKWRFWDNPYHASDFTTLIYDTGENGQGYAIVQNCGNQRFMLCDIVCNPTDKWFCTQMLDSVCNWAQNQGANILRFSTASDQIAPVEVFKAFQRANMFDKFPFRNRRNTDEQFMLRRINTSAFDGINWFVTPIVFEGC